MSRWKETISHNLGWIVCAAYAGLFFSLTVSNIALFILLVFSLLTFSIDKLKKSIQANPTIKLLLVFYLLHLIGLLWSENLNNGVFVLEKKLALLVLPLILFPAMQQVPSREKSKLILGLGVVTIMSSLVFLTMAISKKLIFHTTLGFHRDYFASIPYVFYSVYFATGSLLLLNSLYAYGRNSKARIYVLCLLAVYSLGILVLVSSKTGIVAYVAGLAYFLYVKLASRRLFYLAIAGIISSLILFLVLYPATLDRFIELRDNLSVLKEEKLTQPEKFTGLNLRLYIWKTSVAHLWNDNRLLGGVGTGDAQDYLDEAYKENHLDRYGYLHFDPHNQWIMILLQLGLVGVGLLAAIFISGWRMAGDPVNINFRFFVWTILCFSLSESLLESNKGVVFFALFFCSLYESKRRDLT